MWTAGLFRKFTGFFLQKGRHQLIRNRWSSTHGVVGGNIYLTPIDTPSVSKYLYIWFCLKSKLVNFDKVLRNKHKISTTKTISKYIFISHLFGFTYVDIFSTNRSKKNWFMTTPNVQILRNRGPVISLDIVQQGSIISLLGQNIFCLFMFNIATQLVLSCLILCIICSNRFRTGKSLSWFCTQKSNRYTHRP